MADTIRPLFEKLKSFYLSFAIDEMDLTWRYYPVGLHIWPVVFGIAYVLVVWYLPEFLIQRKLTKLGPKIAFWMKAWNLFLSVLSLGMCLGIGIPLWQFYQRWGLWQAICDEHSRFATPGVNVLWVAIFGYSKFLEMIDTIFLIIKNPTRPVAFLHWYHHLSVMWFTWYASNWRLSAGMTFAAMNSLIHTFMYYYYFQAERGHPPAWAKLLTIGQITQMIIGLGVNIAWAWGYLNGLGCSCEKQDIILIMGTLMYASYLFLFLKFFVQRYILPSPKKETPPHKGKGDSTAKLSNGDSNGKSNGDSSKGKPKKE